MIFVLAQRESHWCLTTQTCLLLFYSSTSLVPINKHLSQGDSARFPGQIFRSDFQVGFSGVIFGCKKRVDSGRFSSSIFSSLPQCPRFLANSSFRLQKKTTRFQFQAGRFFSYISGFVRFLTILGGSMTILGGSIFQLSLLVNKFSPNLRFPVRTKKMHNFTF